MNFSIHIDKRIGERLERLARIRRTSRNALIREALAHLLERAEWPPEVLGFQGVPKAAPFEDARRKLGAPQPGSVCLRIENWRKT